MTTTTITWHDVFNPRRELLLLASAALEICWAYGFFGMALQASGHGQLGVSVFVFAALVLIAIYGSRFVLNLALPARRQPAILIGIALASIVLAMRATLFSNFGLFELSWLGRIPGAIANLFIVFSPESLLLVMGVFAWWRGIALSQAALDFASVGFRFRLGVLMLALLALLNTWIARMDISGLLFAFFFFGLLAVALARQEDVGRSDASVSLPLKGPWLGILAGSALLVLGLGVLLALALTPQGVRVFFDLFRPLEPLVVVILYVVLLIVSFLVELIYTAIAFGLRSFYNPNANAPPLQLPQRPPFEPSQNPVDLAALVALWDPIRSVCAVALFVGVFLLLAFSLNRLQKRERDRGNETRESVPVSLDLDPLKRLRNLFRRPRIELDDSGVASVRRIYANLIRLAAQRGFPRNEAETPYEFLPDLRAAFPNLEPEERDVTEAYVRAHYGEHNPSPAEVARVRAAWEKIKGRRRNPV